MSEVCWIVANKGSKVHYISNPLDIQNLPTSPGGGGWSADRGWNWDVSNKYYPKFKDITYDNSPYPTREIKIGGRAFYV